MAGPFEDGIEAARRADYETVLWLWRPLAERGDAKAQTALGRLYAQGRGVSRDYAAAMGWDRKASDQGDAEAQEALSRLAAPGKTEVSFSTTMPPLSQTIANNSTSRR
jgi:TPR repeat protein